MTDLFNDAPESTRARRASARLRQAKRRAQRRRNVVSFLVMLVALALLVGGGWVLVRPLLDGNEQASEAPTDYPGPGNGEVEVVIEEGASGGEMATVLVEADVVASRTAFVNAFNANPDAAGIQPGTHVLMEQMRAEDVVAAMADGSTLADSRITIPEGWRADQIYARVAERLEVDVAEVEEAAASVATDYLPDVAEGNMEGWLAASTYNVHPDDTATDVLERMVDQTIDLLDSMDVAAEERQDVLIKASIVEAEVILPEDRARAALVIENRLDFCNESGTLGMDSTVAYGLGISLTDVVSQGQSGEDTPYNTHENPGLPPGPINSPSRESIEATLNPAEGDLCYFVTIDLDTGETRFSETLTEHNENVLLLREWQAENS
ncbi:endolytic transglycosylase MltG [Ruania halotolerans]|uniref:endolytic transglycosylase MltG n=1 Tax=Ruania halotolerans TaxID=2897773 RepID=UPI001E658D7F|nr:endolytic transglycosylase MltG [Ruania halotolerans]UFU04744.1 endolytic transglycosylase MltG [Ruania halotolerans]